MSLFTVFVFILGILVGVFIVVKLRSLLKWLIKFVIRSSRFMQKCKEEVSQEIEDCAAEVQDEMKRAE